MPPIGFSCRGGVWEHMWHESLIPLSPPLHPPPLPRACALKLNGRVSLRLLRTDRERNPDLIRCVLLGWCASTRLTLSPGIHLLTVYCCFLVSWWSRTNIPLSLPRVTTAGINNTSRTHVWSGWLCVVYLSEGFKIMPAGGLGVIGDCVLLWDQQSAGLSFLLHRTWSKECNLFNDGFHSCL